MSEKVRTRLEELDDLEEVGLVWRCLVLYCLLVDMLMNMWCIVCAQGSQRELLNLSQQDYVNRIEELNQSLKGSLGFRPESQSPKNRHPGMKTC